MRYFILPFLATVLFLSACQGSAPRGSGGVPVKETLPAPADPAPIKTLPESAAPTASSDVADPPAEETAPEPSTEPATPPAKPPAKAADPPAAKAVSYPGKPYGAEVTGAAMSVPEFLQVADTLEGEVVTLQGTLGHVCDMGCWFFLTDPAFAGAGKPDQIYVDLQGGAIFTIPNTSAGKSAVVSGKVAKNAGGWKVVGKGVVIS